MEPPGAAGACHRAGPPGPASGRPDGRLQPDPVGRPDGKLRAIRDRLTPDYAEFTIGPAEGRTRWRHPGYKRRPTQVRHYVDGALRAATSIPPVNQFTRTSK